MSEVTATIKRPPAIDGRRLCRPYIATPCYGGLLYNTYVDSFGHLLATMQAAGIKYRYSLPGNESLITRARNKLVAAFLKTECSHLVFIDADIGFEPKDIAIMCNSGLDVVCGAYPMKAIGWKNVFEAARGGAEPDKLAAIAGLYAVNPKFDDVAAGKGAVKQIGEHHFLPVHDGATGFMAISRGAIEKAIAFYGDDIAYVADYSEANGEKHHALFDCVIDADGEFRELDLIKMKRAARALHEAESHSGEDSDAVILATLDLAGAASVWARKDAQGPGRYLSEDYAFSRRWQAMGLEGACDGTIYLHLGAHLTHTGTFTFDGDISQVVSVDKPKAAE